MGGGFIQVTPFFGVSTLGSAIAFYQDMLGFSIFSPGGGYAYVERERVALRLLELDAGAPIQPGCSHAYIDVVDVDALFAELAPRLGELGGGRYGPPIDQDYGQREFWVRDPDGNLLNFGQGIGANAGQWDYRK